MDTHSSIVIKAKAIKVRNNTIDLFKAIAIFGVVFIHSMSELSPFIEQLKDSFRFGVPLFILYWAYFLTKSFNNNRDNSLIFFIDKLKQLLIPFLFWSTLYFIVLYRAEINLPILKLISKYWSGYGWSGQYFLVILFQGVLIYPFIYTLGKKKWIVLTSICITPFLYYLITPHFETNTLMSQLSYRPIIYWVPYLLIGIYASSIKLEKVPTYDHKCLFIIVVAVLMASILLPVETFLWKRIGIVHSPYLLVSMIPVTVLLFYVSLKFSFKFPPKIGMVFEYIGERTFAIFLLNPLVIFFLQKKLSIVNDTNFLTPFIIMIVCLVITKLFDTLKLHFVLGLK